MQEVRADLDAHMQAMIEWAEEVNGKAKSNIEKAQEKQKKQFDAKHKPPTFQPGDNVWVYNSRKDTRQGGKLEWNWNGPCKIVEQTSRGTYHLQNEQGKLLKQAVSSNRLKLYIKPENRSKEQEEGEEKQTKGGKTQNKQRDRKTVRM